MYCRVGVCASGALCVLRGMYTCHKVIKRPPLEPQPLRASRGTSQFRQENARHNDEIYFAREAAGGS